MRKIQIKLFFIMVLVIFLLPISVFANDEISLNTDKEYLELGDEITVTAQLNSEEKLYALTATLNYDQSVFEAIDNYDFNATDKEVFYNFENNKFSLINKSGDISDNLLTVHLKVKDDANVGRTTISLTNLSSSDGDTKTIYDDSSVEVIVTRDAKEGEVVPVNKTQDVSNENNNSDLKTFTTTPIIICFAVAFILLVIACIVVNKLNLKNKKKITIILTSLSVFSAIVIIILYCINVNKKDVNNDGSNNYEDANEIAQYIIDIEGTKQNEPTAEETQVEDKDTSSNSKSTSSKKSFFNKKQSSKSSKSTNTKSKGSFKFDVNNDGSIDVSDVADSVQHTTEKTNYKVKLSEYNDENNYYISKDDLFTLSFNATVTPNEQIEKVIIDGKEYSVIQDSSHYNVTLNAPSTAGIHEFEFTKVILSNKREINAKLKIKKEILKDIPYVDMFNVDDENNNFNFRLEDKDEAFIEGKVSLTNDKGEELINQTIEKENHISYTFEEDVKYTITVTGTYDLDSNKLNNVTGEQNLFKDKEMYSHSFIIASNYDFTISNVTISDAIEKNEHPKITFDCTNNKGFNVEYIVVNNEEYDVVVSDGNHYEVILDKIDTSTFGKFEINIDEVVLDNLKDFKLGKDYNTNVLTYNVLKNSPTAENINLTDNKQNKSISVSYNFNDQDSTIQSLSCVLVDSTNKIVDNKEGIEPGNNVELSYEKSSDGRYTVRFLANYNLGTDRHTYTDKNIGEKEILTQVDIKIKNATISTVYPVKNQQKYEITYEVELSDEFKELNKQKNRYNKVSSITINGLNYDANQNKDFTSTLTFTVPSESGVIDLEATRVQLQFEDYNNNRREFFSVAPYILKIDVLKDKPTIQNIEVIDENYDEGNVTLKFDVVDDKGGFESGEVELNNQTQPITNVGTNTVTFTNVKQNEQFNINFYGDYDLDTNTLEDKPHSDNTFKHQQLHTAPYVLYDKSKYDAIKLENLKSISSDSDEYFEKNEEIKLKFNITGLESDSNLTVDKVVINDEEYSIDKEEDGYYVTIPGQISAGLKEIEIDKVILNTGKIVTLTEQAKTNAEILKDPISINDFKYNIDDNYINLNFAIKDIDKSVQGNLSDKLTVKVYNQNDEEIKSIPYSDNIRLEKQNDVIIYNVKVLANFDRDITVENGKNEHKDEVILDEIVSLDKSTIELRDIIDITLYKEKNDNNIVVEEADVNDLYANTNSYFVEISMTETPTVYARIKQVIEEDNKLILVLDYKYVTKENEKDSKDMRIEFGEINNGKAINEARPETLAQLIERIKNNPDGDYKIERDFDANDYTTEDLSMIDVEFTGTLDGKGHTIKNLKKPLFKSLKNATVENIKFTDVRLPGDNAQGTLANTSKESKIKNIFINNFEKNSSSTQSGTLVGLASDNTIIEECKSTNFTLNVGWMVQHAGGLVGDLNNSTIKNSYIIGTVNASWNFVGGFVGSVQGTSTLENNYSKVNLNNGYATVCYGFACVQGKLIAKNNINLNTCTGKINGLFTSNLDAESENNYQLVDENNNSFNQTGVNTITKDQVNEDLFKNTNFNDEIWNYKNKSYNSTPMFNKERVTKIKVDEVGSDYDENKETLYNNLFLLMPFYDSSKIVNCAKNIDPSNPLYSKEIKHIVPVDENGNIVTYITDTNAKRIKKIKIVFNDKSKAEYTVRYETSYDMIASYIINDLKINYTFNHYIIDSNSQLVNNLTNYLSKITYEDNLNKLTPNVDDSRLYREFYNEVTKYELKEFVLKYLSNSNYTNTNNDKAIDDYLEKEIKKDQKLEKLLYVYNYFRRFYDIDVDGIKLYDLILFDSQGFNKDINTEGIVTKFLSNEQNIQLNSTNDTFTRMFSKYTNCNNISEYLEYLVNTLSNKKVDKWMAEQFKGYLVEVNVDGRDDIKYTLWDHLSRVDATYTKVTWFNYVLPILTLPENAAYILSTPTQFTIGAQRTYTANPDNPSEQAELRRRVNQYAKRMKTYYTTSSKILKDAKYFNDINTTQIDKRWTKEKNGASVFQNPYTTQEPFHKNFNEVVGVWAYNDYNAATANGTQIIWRVEGIFDGDLEKGSEYTYETWSHETAHNMDARLFLKNNGRRFDAGGEDYADGNLTQTFNDGDIVMNLSKDLTGTSSNISANLSPSRIASPEDIHDFYKKLFDTVYILDYLEGRAFLELNSEEKSKIAVQASYPKEENAENWYQKHNHTVYQQIDKEKYDQMTLESLDDLYANNLVIYPGIIYSTYTENRYGGENIYKVRWYQPHNDDGRPDSYSIKWLAYEMLGYAGYDEGYIEYYSNINSTTKDGINGYKSDLMALKKITNDDSMTFDKYKKKRFDYVEQNLQNIQFIDVNDVFLKFYNALKEDAAYVKQVEEQAYKNYPGNSENDVKNRNNMISKAKAYTNSTQVRREVYYTIKNNSNEFTGNVYDANHPHEVGDFTVPEEDVPVETSENEEANVTDVNILDNLDKSNIKEVEDNKTNNEDTSSKENNVITEDEQTSNNQNNNSTTKPEDKNKTDNNVSSDESQDENVPNKNTDPLPDDDVVPSSPEDAIVDKHTQEEKNESEQEYSTNTTGSAPNPN